MLDYTEDDLTLKLTFKGSMTIYRARDLTKELSPLNWKKDKLDIDLSQVDEIDSAGVQLLMMIAKASKEFDSRIKITHSYSSQQAFEILNLNQNLSP